MTVTRLHKLFSRAFYIFRSHQLILLASSVSQRLFNDDHGTSVQKSRNISTLTWDDGKFRKTLKHSNNRLLEISVNEDINNGGGVKIRNMLAASTFHTAKTVLPKDSFDSTKVRVDSDDLVALFTKSDRRDPVGIVRADQDASYNDTLKKRLIATEQYKIGDTVQFTRDGYTEEANYENIELSKKPRNINYV